MTAAKKIDRHFHQNRYIYLLASTLLLVFLTSFFPDRNDSLVNELCFSFFMVANINFIRHKRRIIFVMLLFAMVSIWLAWTPKDAVHDLRFLITQRMIFILFISVIIFIIITQIVKSKDVSVNMILGVITIYILFGLLAGDCNQLISYFDPDAFTGNFDPADISDLRYYSYVTMTTLGYGDIAPVSQMARASAVFFSLIGQIYLAVVIALIVGKYISHSDKNTTHEKN